MNPDSISRRDFIAGASVTAAAALLSLPSRGSGQPAAAPASPATPSPSRWPIGCHARPFRPYHLSPDALLDAMKGAGYASADMIAAEVMADWSRSTAVPPDTIASLKERLAARGLKSTVESLEVPPDVPLEEAYAIARKQVGFAHALGQSHMLSLGTTKPGEWVRLCKVLSYAAAFGQERGVQIVIKQHNGLNRTAVELLGWAKQVNNPNFGLFYDAGNVVYYTGADPVEQLDIIGPYVTGFVAKDCTGPQYEERRAGDPGFGTKPPNPHGDEVLIEFGTGTVDFAGIFKKLKSVGFSGPVMVEGVAVGSTLRQTVENARANRQYLEKVFAKV